MEKIFICDFNDSFTYNIYSEIKSLRPATSVEVIPFADHKIFFEKLSIEEEKRVVILGPGPGHPRDYLKTINFLTNCLLKENIFFMGICLGHQILWRALGYDSDTLKMPIHGQSRRYQISDSELLRLSSIQSPIEVQQYNSLAVKLDPLVQAKLRADGWLLVMNDNELIMSKKGNLLTYQFHPESIGTQKRFSFFEPIFEFLGVVS